MASIFKRGEARRAGRRFLSNSFGVIVVACTALALSCDPKGEPKANAPEAPIKPGDTVKVTSGPAPVKVGDKALTTLEAGSEFTAIAVQDAWVKVAIEKDGRKITGWINKRYVKLVVPLGIWDGFRGIAWATPVADIKGMELMETLGDSAFYKRVNDKLAIGEARLDGIKYGFYKGRFAEVEITCESWAYSDLERAVGSIFGESKSHHGSASEMSEGRTWEGRSPDGELVWVFLRNWTGPFPDGTLTVLYVPLSTQIQRDRDVKKGAEENAAAEKARKDF